MDQQPPLSEAQRAQILNQWNDTHVAFETGHCVHALFERHARLRPSAIAVGFEGRNLTFAELNAEANKIAHHLIASGVQPDARVAICVERGLPMIIGLLAILKAGAAYVPLDPAYPDERLAYLLSDSTPAAILTATAFDDRLALLTSDSKLPRFVLDGADPAWADGDAVDPAIANLTDRHLAYVIYTSGSTGMPKGVMVEHASLVNYVFWQSSACGFDHDDVFLQRSSTSFDMSAIEIWTALTIGARLQLAPLDAAIEPALLAATMATYGVTVACFTPSLLQTFLDQRDDTTSFLCKTLLVGGEALGTALAARARAVASVALFNLYGPTEITIVALFWRCPAAGPIERVLIGRPIANSRIYLLDSARQPVPVGATGELFVGGANVARGYLNRPELNAERFLPDPFNDAPGARMYRTGDLGRWLPDGTIEYLGRNDFQVKIRGYRIELGEIEDKLAQFPGVRASAVIRRAEPGEDERLVAYVVTADATVGPSALRDWLSSSLPHFMVPATFVFLPELPVNTSGKLDRAALPAPAHIRPALAQPYQSPIGEREALICQLFAQQVGIDRAGRLDNFFDLGGSSLDALRVLASMKQATGQSLPAALFFNQPTAAAIAFALTDQAAPAIGADRAARGRRSTEPDDGIAIIAMAGRFPGANDIETLWRNLRDELDVITEYRDDQLDPSIDAAERSDPAYVKARSAIADVDKFDAAFFGITPAEASIMDPQQRIFLELCWECLERGGHVPDACQMPVGVFGGVNTNTYFSHHVQAHPDLMEQLGKMTILCGNEKDFITTRVAHRLNLTGPAVSVHTACSTSLVAVVQAVNSLRAGQCDMALAGGVSVVCPPNSGYMYMEGAMLSPDARTRTFDASAAGTVFGDGAAVLLLKRVADALADNDPILAVIRGVAINNDGRDKASFTAPSVDGQTAVVHAALNDAGFKADQISYVEAHGTATPLGDPIEITALTKAYRLDTDAVGFCRIGSIKSNLGHMVTAAGAGGLIKTALSLAHQELPATMHFKVANPNIDFASTPFVVTAQRTPWPRSAIPRRAGVSAFGVGGTNAHVIVEEAPLLRASDRAYGPQLLHLSARTPVALSAALQRLADHLDANPDVNLADVAWTLRVGRKAMAQRACVVASSVADAVARLRADNDPLKASGAPGEHNPGVIFMFPGQAAQYPAMGAALYEHEPAFRRAFDDCLAALDGVIDFDLKTRLFDGDAAALTATATTQPALFCIEYALAQYWIHLGLQPMAMIGHSLGEFVAATLAGVFTLPDAVRLIARRGQLMQALPSGAMLAVRLGAAELLPHLPDNLSLAAENGPAMCVVAGPAEAVAALQRELEQQAVSVRPLQTSHAFHSAMMDPAIAPFEAEVRRCTLSAPTLPIWSTVTGALLTDAQACDPAYWARHLRETVRFSPALINLTQQIPGVLLEVGPRSTLTTLARQHARPGHAAPFALASLADSPASEHDSLRLAAGRLWADGVSLDLAALDTRQHKQRLTLPGYAFERTRHWLEARLAQPVAQRVTPASQQPPIPDSSETTMSAALTPNRIPELIAQLRHALEETSGIAMDDAPTTANFAELGLDSLTLTQVATQLKQRFKINVTFRQLMEGCRTLDTLATWLDSQIPAAPAPVAAPVPAMAATAVAAPMASVMPNGSAANATIHQVIAQQMQIMAQQLALLQGTPLAAPAAVAVSAPTVALMPPPAVVAVEAQATAPATSIKYDVKTAFGAIARIHTEGTGLSERQRARLDAFVRRYIERTRASKEFTQANRPHLADPRVVNGFRPAFKEIVYQLVVNRSHGAKLWDLDGNEYVDVTNGFGMSLFGWQPPFVVEAVKRQLELGYEIGPMHPLAGEVAALICELTGHDRAGLCNTGSEAVMGAMRIARTVTSRNLIVLFSGSYHGTFDEVIVRGTKRLRPVPAAPGILSNTTENVIVLDYGTPESLEIIRARGDEIAAVLIEPVQSRRPDFQPAEYLRQLRALTQQIGAVFILDEVITGFRAALGGIQQLFGLRADICTYGKTIGGGFPIGVIAGKREFLDALDGGAWQYGDDSIPSIGVTYFAGTFVRHPLALAAAKASLEHLKAQGPALQETLNDNTTALAARMNAICRDVGAPVEIRHFSSLWKIFFTEDHPMQDLLFAMMRNRGIHILDNFPCYLTTAHSAADIACISTAFQEALVEMQESDFLPRRVSAGVAAYDADRPPVPNARLGKDAHGNPAWFVPDTKNPGKYLRLVA
jgi:amino acid adenylation domain-containing protein